MAVYYILRPSVACTSFGRHSAVVVLLRIVLFYCCCLFVTEDKRRRTKKLRLPTEKDGSPFTDDTWSCDVRPHESPRQRFQSADIFPRYPDTRRAVVQARKHSSTVV